MFEELNKLSNISSEDTEEVIENASKDIIDRKFDWTELYGKLEARKIYVSII